MEESQDVVGQEGNGQPVQKDEVHPMTELLDTSFQYRELHHGDVVEGTIVHVSSAEVLIDIGSKSEGVLAGRERERMGPEASSELDVGQKVLVYVLNPEDKNGNVVLSLSHAQLERDWREAEKRFQEGEIFSCAVASFNKGGLIANVGKVRGFIPASQLVSMPRGVENDERRAEELAKLVGEEFQLKIIEVDRKRNRLILSQRAAARETRQEQREKLLSSLEQGTRVRGRVSNLCDFGAFVNLGGADGLIHISELSWGRVSHPSEILGVGDEVEVYVLNVEPERQRIGLSLKRLQPEPWARVEEEYAVDQIVQGKVTKLTTFGAFVRIDNNIEGLIHISELADRHVNHPKEILKEGEEVSVRIIRIDPDRKRIGLSLKGAEEQTEVDWQVADEGDEDTWDEDTLADESAGLADEVDVSLEDPESIVEETVAEIEEEGVVLEVSEPVAEEMVAAVVEDDVIPEEPEPIADEIVAVVDEDDVVPEVPEPVAEETAAPEGEEDLGVEEPELVTEETSSVVDEEDVVADVPEAVADEAVVAEHEGDAVLEEPEPVVEEPVAVADEVDAAPEGPEAVSGDATPDEGEDEVEPDESEAVTDEPEQEEEQPVATGEDGETQD